VLWVSEHLELLGDPKLTSDHQLRFLPSRFTPEGNALDARGMTCTTLACPRCHLSVPRVLTEVEPLFVSILGAPTSGKSFFLASMTWHLRRVLSTRFATSFTDVDTTSNSSLNAYEESLFLSPTPDEVVPLGGLIKKTEEQGDLYDSVRYGRQTVSYVRPFIFSLRPQAGHPYAHEAARLSHVLCVYDNAGEHFLPGGDKSSTPATRHLARSQLLFCLFDPTQDQRLRARCRNIQGGSSAYERDRLSRQETILNEAAARVRRHAGLASNARHDKPLIVVLSKSDEWAHLLETVPADDPYVVTRDGLGGLNSEAVLEQSQAIRRLMLEYCPEIVSAAEDFSTKVTYVAVSSLGERLEPHPQSGKMGIRPRNIRPHWVTVPMVYGLNLVLPKLIPRIKRGAGGVKG